MRYKQYYSQKKALPKKNIIVIVMSQISFSRLKHFFLVFGKNNDHAYYTSKIHGPGDAASRELWVNVNEMEEEWKVCDFLSSPRRQAEVGCLFSGELLLK